MPLMTTSTVWRAAGDAAAVAAARLSPLNPQSHHTSSNNGNLLPLSFVPPTRHDKQAIDESSVMHGAYGHRQHAAHGKYVQTGSGFSISRAERHLLGSQPAS